MQVLRRILCFLGNYRITPVKVLTAYPHELSGGGQQRAAIARALIAKPSILLADEPTGNLDSRSGQNVLGLLKMSVETYHQTLVMITHNLEIAQMADRVDGSRTAGFWRRGGKDMIANNNLKVCRTLVRRDVRFHPVKYILLSCAAMLVTALYTFVFLLGSSVEDAYLLNYQYSYGSTSHILYTGLTEKQADTLTGNSSIEKYSASEHDRTVIRSGDRAEKNQSAVTDRAYAQTVLSVPTVGTLPEKNGEIALDEFTMDSLGIPHEIGNPY